MKAILDGKKSIGKWMTKLVQCLYKRARKEPKKYKDKPPKQTAWEIIMNLQPDGYGIWSK